MRMMPLILGLTTGLENDFSSAGPWISRFPMSDHSLDSWKSAASEASSFDGGNQMRGSSDGSKNTIPLYSGHNSNSRDYQQMAQKEKSYGSKSPSPQNHDDFLQTMPPEKHADGRYFTPHDSANTSSGSTVYGSNYSSPLNSAPGETEYGHMATHNRQVDSKIPAMLQSINNMNLEVRTKGSPQYSVSGSSDISEVLSFPSDISFEIMDPSRVSDSSRSSTSSQAADLRLFRGQSNISKQIFCPTVGLRSFITVKNNIT